MRVKIFSFITAISIGFSSLIFPFFSVSAFAQQAVIPWVPIFRFIGETLGAYFIDKGADYAVNQLTGSGRKMTDDEYNATSKDWDACVSYMKSQGCTDSDIENLQAQIEGGDLDLSSKVGKAMKNFFAQKGANINGSWDNFNKYNVRDYETNTCPDVWDSSALNSFLLGQGIAIYDYYSPLHVDSTASDFLADLHPIGLVLVGHIKWFDITVPRFSVIYYNYDKLTYSVGYDISIDLPHRIFWGGGTNVSIPDNATYYCSEKNKDLLEGFLGSNKFHTKFPINNKVYNSISLPNKISSFGGNIPHYFDNTIDNDDSSKNTYNNTPAHIDWSKIFDSDVDKNPTFKKIDGYTPPEPKIREDGSNYDDVVKQLQEANSKLAKILGWLEDFDYDNNGKIKDHRLSPIEPNTPLFNFKLSEKFPFSLPWDMLAILSILKATPVAPKYEFPIMLPDESGKVKPIKLSDDRIGVIQGDKIVLDFTSQDWQDTAKILRWGELVLFICGLCVVFWKYGK